MNSDTVQAELADLRERTKGIKEYTNKRVAHFDAKGPKDSPGSVPKLLIAIAADQTHIGSRIIPSRYHASESTEKSQWSFGLHV
jgi:hypothetical protein